MRELVESGSATFVGEVDATPTRLAQRTQGAIRIALTCADALVSTLVELGADPERARAIASTLRTVEERIGVEMIPALLGATAEYERRADAVRKQALHDEREKEHADRQRLFARMRGEGEPTK